MKSKYFKVLLISVILFFILAGCGRRAAQQGTTVQAPSIDSELNSLDKGLKDVNSMPSDVEVPPESSVSSSTVQGPSTSSSSNPVDEFNKLSNSMDEGISDVEATPSDVAEG